MNKVVCVFISKMFIFISYERIFMFFCRGNRIQNDGHNSYHVISGIIRTSRWTNMPQFYEMFNIKWYFWYEMKLNDIVQMIPHDKWWGNISIQWKRLICKQIIWNLNV